MFSHNSQIQFPWVGKPGRRTLCISPQLLFSCDLVLSFHPVMLGFGSVQGSFSWSWVHSCPTCFRTSEVRCTQLQSVYWSLPLYLNFYVRDWSPTSMSPFEGREHWFDGTLHIWVCRGEVLEAWLKAHHAVLQRPLVPCYSVSPPFPLIAKWCFLCPLDLETCRSCWGTRNISPHLLWASLGTFTFPLVQTLVFSLLPSPFPRAHRLRQALWHWPWVSGRWNPEQLRPESVLQRSVLFPSRVGLFPFFQKRFLYIFFHVLPRKNQKITKHENSGSSGNLNWGQLEMEKLSLVPGGGEELLHLPGPLP